MGRVHGAHASDHGGLVLWVGYMVREPAIWVQELAAYRHIGTSLNYFSGDSECFKPTRDVHLTGIERASFLQISVMHCVYKLQ